MIRFIPFRGAGAGRAIALAAVLLLHLAALPAALRAQEGGVRGVVRSGGNGEPLQGAVVELVGVERPRSTMAGVGGGYVLSGISAGRRLVRASHIGHAPLEVEVLVPPGREVEIELVLPLQPVGLAPLQVEGGRTRAEVDTMAAPAPELSIAGARAMQSSPGITELGLADAVRGIPGQEPADPSHILYVRGAAADLKLVYLDGAPVYAPFPLGGLLESFSPGILSAADVYVGGAPARYDGGLSYVLDLQTRGVRPNRVRSAGAVDMLSGRAMVEVPLGERGGVLASGRSVHGLASTTTLPYGYGEGLVRADLRLGSTALLSATGFHNRESVWLTDPQLTDSTIAWGNHSVSARLTAELAGNDLELTAALGSFEARLPLESPRPILAEGNVRRTRFAADLSRRVGEVSLRYGAAYDEQSQSYRGRYTSREAQEPSWASARGAVGGLYVDAAGQPLARVRLRGGLRLDHFSLGGTTTLAPRLSATWLITDRAALTLAGGRYHQYLRAPEAALIAASNLPQYAATGYASALSVGSATHLTAALDQDLGEGIRFGIEGYFKNYEGLPGSSRAEANASGVDLWLRRGRGEVTGWVGYSLAWFWAVESGSMAASSFSGRHLLSAGIAAPLGERSKVNLGFAYGAGLPYSSIPLAPGDWTPENTPQSFTRGNVSASSEIPPLIPTPERAYLRLDLSASRTWTPTVFGSRVEIGSYLKVLNTLGRRDALFYRFDRDIDDAPRAVDALPLVPVAGVEWKF